MLAVILIDATWTEKGDGESGDRVVLCPAIRRPKDNITRSDPRARMGSRERGRHDVCSITQTCSEIKVLVLK